VTLDGPAGELAANSITLDRNKAQYLLFAGKKRPAEGWSKGNSAARVSVLRDGREVMQGVKAAKLE
jgi:hypothetical protein